MPKKLATFKEKILDWKRIWHCRRRRQVAAAAAWITGESPLDQPLAAGSRAAPPWANPLAPDLSSNLRSHARP